MKIDRDHLQLQAYFKEENKAVQETSCKRCLILVSVCPEMGKKKKKEILLNLHGETEVFNKWPKKLANL